MRTLTVAAILLAAFPLAAADATSPAIAAAREFASQTLTEAEAHPATDETGSPVLHRRTTPRAAPRVEVGALRSALSDRQLDVFSISASAFTLAVASPADTDAAVEALINQMNRAMFANPDVQHHLLVALGARAVPALSRHLNDSMVLDVLADIGPDARAAVPALKAVLGTRNVEVASTLVAIGTEDALAAAMPVLIRVAGDPYDPWAKEAAIALGRTRRQAAAGAVPVLRRLLATPDPETRLYAAIALSRLGDAPSGARALAALVRSQKLEDPYRALAALRQLGTQAVAPAREDLIAFVLDTYQKPEQRAEVARTLAMIAPRDAQVVGALRTVAADPALAMILSSEVRAVVPR